MIIRVCVNIIVMARFIWKRVLSDFSAILYFEDTLQPVYLLSPRVSLLNDAGTLSNQC